MKSYYDKLLEMAEYKAFHGTPNVFYEFDHRLSGNEGLGAGFYFTDDPSEASGYAEPKYKDDLDNSNIKIVKLNINNPIILDLDNNPKQRPLNRTQISKLLKASPYFDESLMNFGDVEYEGFDKVFSEAVSGFLNMDLFRQFELIRGDFYDDDLKIYAPIFKKITGYDAVKKTYNDGHNVYVVWDNDQIKNYYGESYNLSESYEYEYCCISPKSAEELDFIISNMKEVSTEKFYKNISMGKAIEAVRSGVGVDYDFNPDLIKTDWSNRYYYINKKGIDAYILVNSGVEHIFKNTEPKTTKPKTPKYKSSGNLKEYKGFKIGDILTKSKFKILDIHQQPNGLIQFFLKTPSGDFWYDAKQVVNYETR